MGPDGQPLFQIEGPHAAPFQHIKEYINAMVIGGGIGCTPMAAAMKQLIFHRFGIALIYILSLNCLIRECCDKLACLYDIVVSQMGWFSWRNVAQSCVLLLDVSI